jgi:hypothetical protein
MSSYKFTVPNGVYQVELDFAEIYCTAPNCRVFSVTIQGSTVLSNLDLFAVAGKNTAYIRTYAATVSNGVLTIGFSAIINSAKINAIHVWSLVPATVTATATPAGPTATPTPTGSATPAPAYVRRVNAGGPQYLDTRGNTWLADRLYTAGGWGYLAGQVYANPAGISGTGDPALYQTHRYNVTSYRFTVPNGNYRVTLKFAEIYAQTGTGQRVFNVRIEGVVVISNLDLVALVGHYVAKDYVFNTTVSDNVLSIDFNPIAGPPIISAIEVIATSGGPTPIPTPTNTYQNPAPTVVVEAESGTLVPYMTRANDTTASGGQYIVDPGGPNDNGSATYQFWVPYVNYTFDAYIIWARLWPPSGSSSMFFALDGGTPAQWYASGSSGWYWSRGPDPAAGFTLTQGMTHTLQLTRVGNGTKLDVIIFTDRHSTNPPLWP